MSECSVTADVVRALVAAYEDALRANLSSIHRSPGRPHIQHYREAAKKADRLVALAQEQVAVAFGYDRETK